MIFLILIVVCVMTMVILSFTSDKIDEYDVAEPNRKNDYSIAMNAKTHRQIFIPDWVDKDGTEWVWSYCPLRNKYRGVWDAPYNDDDYVYRSIELPKGSIEKLIGKTLTWADEPYEMEE